ncbi:DUF771 domain-containing protein [Lysinibacillus fusiformis]|nr:DUF771 domain-containing protein [Lysinibacillus fusiformis]
MQQQLSVNLTIPIPSDSVLITKAELEELNQSKYDGVYWTMKDVEIRVGKKSDWIKERILYPPNLRKKLDVNFGEQIEHIFNISWDMKSIKQRMNTISICIKICSMEMLRKSKRILIDYLIKRIKQILSPFND